MSCTLCDLHKTAKNVLVPIRGSLRRPKILFVGIGPGPDEDREGKCFVGLSGQTLNEVLQEVGVPLEDVAFDNIVHCFPQEYGQIRDPNPDEILTCSPYLFSTIRAVDPVVIVALGTLAFRVLSGEKEAFITDRHGQAVVTRIAGKERLLVGSFHPSAANRQQKIRGVPHSYLDALVNDVRYAWDHANGKYFLPKHRTINDTQEAVSWIENMVALFQSGQIKFVALDTEGPQIQLTVKQRRQLGIEIMSSDIWNPQKRSVGISLSYIPPGCQSFADVEGVFIPMDHPESKVDYQLVGWALKWALDQNGLVRVPVSFHNQKYDDQWCREKHDFQAICYHDTMLGSFVYHGQSISHGLGNVAHKLLKYALYKDEPGEYLDSLPLDQRSFYNVPLEILGKYAAIDAAATASLTVLELAMLERSGQKKITEVLTEGTSNFANIEYNGAAIDYEKWQHHMKRYPEMMEEAKSDVMALPMVQVYINDRRTVWTQDPKGNPRAPDPKFEFNPNSPPQRYDLLYRYFRFPEEYAEETKSSQEHEEDPDYIQVWSTNENSRHMMTLHVRDEAYEGKCTCRSYVPGWDTFGEVSAQAVLDQYLQTKKPSQGVIEKLYSASRNGNGTIRIRTWDYYHPVNYKHYNINPHPEGYEFLIKIRFWGKLRKVYNDYLKKIEHYFRPVEWQQKHGDIPLNLRIVSNNYILHWVKCVSRGSLIETDEGKIPIEDLYDRFISSEFVSIPKILDGVIYRYPLEVVYVGWKPSVTLIVLDSRGVSHTISGSYHHMVWTTRSFVCDHGWKRLDRFKVGDRLVVSNGPGKTLEARVCSVSFGESEFFDISMDASHDTHDQVECRICGHAGQLLTKHIKTRHELNVEQYLEMYPGSPLSSDSFNSVHAETMRRVVNRMWSFSSFREMLIGDEVRGKLRSARVGKKPMLGKPQTSKQREAASAQITRLNLAGDGAFKKQRQYPFTDKLGRRFVFKSSFEISYAFFLESVNASWDYEPETFRYNSSKGFLGSYTPDFKVDGRWVEIKPEWKHQEAQEFLDVNFPHLNIDLVGESKLTDLGAFQMYYDSTTKVAAVGATLSSLNSFYGPKLKYGYVANGFICHNTGRLATRDFAIHTVPWHSDPRRLFVSRWKNIGGLMLSADYSQLELRVAAAIGKDEKLIQAYRDGKDVHRVTASNVYKVPENEVTQAMRRYSKTMSFRLIYGGGAQAISDETGLSKKEAQVMIDNFLAHYNGIDKSIKAFHHEVETTGRVITPMRRVFYLPDIYSEDKSKHAGALRDSQNYPIQSSSSDVTMTAINMVCRDLRRTQMNSLIWAMIHDAIESDLYPGELLSYYKILKHAMEVRVCEEYDWLCVPMVAEFELGVRWDGALTVKELDDQHMVLKGRRGFYDETMEFLARGYQFESKIKKEVYIGTHKPCKGDGEVDAVTHKCKKCEQIVNPDTDLDYGETLILRKSYEGESGGNTEVTTEIVWRQYMEHAA